MAIGGQVGHGNRRFGCFLISSPQGRSGKTVVTLGLCDLFKRQGLSVQPFKKGPDYIDPSWLTVAAGRSCRNLDPFLIPRDKLIQTFGEACRKADLAVIEGAMGLYDGLNSHGTTAEVARILNAPILLVVNASRMTGSIAAMVTGYQRFEKDIRIAGVILNYVSGPRHEEKLRSAVDQHCGIPVLGSLPKDQDLHLAERHLGLIPTIESGEAESLVEKIGRRMEPHVDLDRLSMIARSFKPDPSFPLARREKAGRRGGTRHGERVRIGVVRDRAFNFYYPENLEALTDQGAELLYINSFSDRLPSVDGLYIGGGFPEFFLRELEENRRLRKEIAREVERGLPVYAECAGLMYLCRSVRWEDRSYEMVGVLPSRVELSKRPRGHGYVVARVTAENPLWPLGLTVRGHEFHHSGLFDCDDIRFAYQVERGQGIRGGKDGIVYKNVFASYIHVHASGTPEWAPRFVTLASRAKAGLKVSHAEEQICIN